MSPIHALIKNVLVIYLNNFKYFLGLLGIALIWNLALAVIPVDLATSLRLLWPIAIASLIISLFTELALIKGFAAIAANQQAPIGKILLSALVKLPWFIMLSLIWSVIVFTGLVLFIIPGIAFANWLIFFPVLYIIENQKGLRIFKASKLLVDRAFFPILVRAAAIIFISIVLAKLASRGFEFISLTIIPDQYLSARTSIQYSASGIISSLIQPLIPGTLVLLYYEIRKMI